MQLNEVKHGFRLLKTHNVPEVSGETFEFVHEKTGAKLFYLKNDDDNKVFYIAFRTPPKDNTGVAHIIEHSVLCGSRKYPLKEPFVELVKGSLNTFLNAMTYPDKTVYPVASRNDHDFANLMDVYLDAVFYPAIYSVPEILLQEGWHYEMDDSVASLKYSGVVYNEMKGALSSPDSLLESRIMASLYPDTAYGFESGGDPKYIPTLTQEKFLDFHRKYYHPSNSYIYLYGDLDIDERLTYLDEEYLAKFERLEVDSSLAKQPRFTAPKRLEEHYPCGEKESAAGRTFLSLNFLLDSSMTGAETMAMEFLDQALITNPASPLRRAIIESGLGKDIDSEFSEEMLEPFYSIVVEGSEAQKAAEFHTLVMDTLQKLCRDGIDRQLLTGAINSGEFRMREADFGTTPKGLIYGLRSLKSWLYGGDPTDYLYYEETLATVKEGLNKGYFESLVEKFFLKNNHVTLLTLAPDKTMGARREAELQADLGAKNAELTDADRKKIIAANERLLKRQQTPDSPEALATIPILALKDIRPTPEDLPLEERSIDGTKILFTDVPTHGIAYVALLFDALKVPQQNLMYLYLLLELLGDVDTDKHGYGELNNLVNLSTGGLDYNLTVYADGKSVDSWQPYAVISAKALTGKLSDLGELLTEILLGSRFDDGKRLQELLLEIESGIETDMQSSAHSIAITRLAGYLTPAGRYASAGSLPFYRFVKELLADFPAKLPEIQENLCTVQKQIFNRADMLADITMTEADYQKAVPVLGEMLKSFPDTKVKQNVYTWPEQEINEGLLSSSSVQYVVKGADFTQLGYEFNGVLKVVETLLRYDYFWTRIRMQGGAYGAFTAFQRSGFMMFASYRDPKLKETLAVFDSVPEYLATYETSEREFIKVVIGTISHIDVPLTPKMKGAAALDCYLRHVSYADRQKARDQVLNATQADIHAIAVLIADCMKANYRCVFGNENTLKENADAFDSLLSVLGN